MADVSALNAAFIAARDASGTTTPSKTDAAASQDQLSSDLNFFLTMLTTQLKNQDPSSPMDTNAFTQQIAQYSGVQQQVTTNSNLEKLLAQGKQSSITTAVGYIGKEVESAGNTGMVIGGQGAFSYELPSTAAKVSITIKDSTGNIMFEGTGDTKAGRNLVVWDGINSSTGKQMPDGTYTLSVTALDTSNKDIAVTTHSVAIVTGVETDKDGNTLLTIGDKTMKFSDVTAVRTPTRADLGTGNDTTAGGNDTTAGGTT